MIHLPPKELAALRLLLAHAGQIVTVQQLKQALWGDVHVTDDSVPKCVSSLRELLLPTDCIQTVYKRGYRFSIAVRPQSEESRETPARLAIMPFAVDPSIAAYLGPAIAEETISLLTADRMAPAHVLARDSAFSLAARGLTAHQVGEALQADLVLTGTLRMLPAQFRLRAEMIRVSDCTQIWVEDMLVPQARSADLESELANRLFIRLSATDWYNPREKHQSPAGRNGRLHREAWELFLRGHHEWQTMQRHRMQEGIQHLIRAVELDPTLYAAHVDLANAAVTQEFAGFISPQQAAQQVRIAADAVPTSVEGAEALLPALGWIRFHVDHDLPGALRAFSTSSHLRHETSVTRARSMFALSRRRFKEAIELILEALRTDPYSPWLNSRLAWAYHLSGERDKSVAQAEHALELFPEHESTNAYASIIMAFNGNAEKAVAVAESLVRRSPYLDIGSALYAYALAQAGREQEARSMLERLQWLSRERFVLTSFTAAVCVALGELDSAVAELESAADARCPWLFQMLADPRIEPVRERPEVVKIERSLERMEAAGGRKAAHDQ
ncbi:winged helix-turn-helix domain-containing protein [Occallatibacter savannae]|uniref:winged helix-turn-helix domain-containing protein n=1 Tax=Occallatibacter savannae TaxID=1002691 RepID=UPI0013A55B0D|nr:winged helix-turn-helix domain-containing protein [Occallatibacter savannae]